MALLTPFFFLIWSFVTIILALLWYIYEQQENMFFERENLREERERLALQSVEERKDLYDRLMAGTLPQYKEQQDASSVVEDTTDENLQDLEDAKEEITNVE